LVSGLLALLVISFDNNFDFNGQMEYPLLSFAVGMNGVCMDISLVLVIASQFLFLFSYFLFLISYFLLPDNFLCSFSCRQF